MDGKNSEADTEEEAGREKGQSDPASEWKKTFQTVRHDFSLSYLPNTIVGAVSILIGPAIGVIVKSPKVILISAVIGVTLAVWFVGYFVYKRLPEAESYSKPPVASPSASTPTPAQNAVPPIAVPATSGSLSPRITPPNNAPVTFFQETPAMPNKKPEGNESQPLISQSIGDNSPNARNTIGDVTINQSPPPRHLTAEQKSVLITFFRTNPKGAIRITCLAGDREARDFAQEIAGVLTTSGWQVEGPLDMLPFFKPGLGPLPGLFMELSNR